MMCRLLAVKAGSPFAITPHLEKFATISKHSKEYQGHGWGCAYQDDTQGGGATLHSLELQQQRGLDSFLHLGKSRGIHTLNLALTDE